MNKDGLLDAHSKPLHKQSQDEAKATHPYDFLRHHSGLVNTLAGPFSLYTSPIYRK
jgi:hypothetical protein